MVTKQLIRNSKELADLHFVNKQQTNKITFQISCSEFANFLKMAKGKTCKIILQWGF